MLGIGTAVNQESVMRLRPSVLFSVGIDGKSKVATVYLDIDKEILAEAAADIGVAGDIRLIAEMSIWPCLKTHKDIFALMQDCICIDVRSLQTDCPSIYRETVADELRQASEFFQVEHIRYHVPNRGLVEVAAKGRIRLCA